MPALDIRFRRFTSLNTTIRLREGSLHVRLSDLLEHAPESVHHAIAHILLAKLYRKPIARTHSDRYRRHVSSEPVARQAELIRQTRGRKTILTAKGHYYDLDEVFESLNRRFFHGPGIANWDFALLKDTRITERINLQFRAEFFNVLNHTNFNNPSGNFSSSNFGVVTSARDPRIGQLGLKFQW